MNDRVYEYKQGVFPYYLKDGNACQYIAPIALKFCRGDGLDIGAGRPEWALPGAKPIDMALGHNAMALPPPWDKKYDFIFSSHCLEHLSNPVKAIEHWKTHLKPGGVLFLYLPHPDMTYWLPQHNRKHLHSWPPKVMAQLLCDLGFVDVLHSERDLMWSFACVGFNG